jgi:formylglycine-generating enzyme required for sulfatase activity
MIPVGDISWRMAAEYCNWLCNNKGTDRSAFLNGAYDVSTFGSPATQQTTHTPGAPYWLPTFDESLKAAHFDPNRNGPGQGGWWAYSITSDTAPRYGPPGVLIDGQPSQANAGWSSQSYPGLSPFAVPLGAYPTVQSPWGLLDTAGGTTEWTESLHVLLDGTPYNIALGSFWSEDPFQALLDDGLTGRNEELPYILALEFGVRIASSVPAPGTGAAVLGVFATLSLSARRRKRPRARSTPSPEASQAKPRAILSISASLLIAILAADVRADIDPNSGIDFVHISAPGNAPWPGNGTAGDLAIGRGGVNYEYNIGRFEVATAQWVEFFNAAFDRPPSDRLPNLIPPDHWGAAGAVPNTPGGLRWSVPAGNEMLPVGDISWRMAAMYCNWLCNNKSTDRSAFLNGAYDVSTFAYNGNAFTDQPAHTPGAQYWIPTLDEWIKAAHYDPNRNGPGQGGYWIFSITRDTPPLPGPPPSMGGSGEANFGFTTGPVSPFSIPLGAYTNIASPWGLYDTAGATAEWTEGIGVEFGQNRSRAYEGSWWTASPGDSIADAIYAISGDFPSLSTYDLGFRIASSVPAPGAAALGVGVLAALAGSSHRRRKPGHPHPTLLGPSSPHSLAQRPASSIL